MLSWTWFHLATSLGVLAFTLFYLLESPLRAYRLAALSGAFVQLELVAARALVYSPERWSLIQNPPLVRGSIAFLGAWLLILNGLIYVRWRQEGSRSIWLWCILSIPVLALVMGGILLEARLYDRYAEVMVGLPYDMTVAAVAVLGPALTFELLWKTDLWQDLKDAG